VIKNGKIEVGKTPSEDSGRPCSKIVEGEPLDKQGKPQKNIEKVAQILDSNSCKKKSNSSA
jgi:hypothetical protein